MTSFRPIQTEDSVRLEREAELSISASVSFPSLLFSCEFLSSVVLKMGLNVDFDCSGQSESVKQ